MSEPAQTDGNPFSKGYKYRDGQPVSDACGDDRHAECMQDLTKCHCHVRSGHTTMHAYMNPGGRAQTAGKATTHPVQTHQSKYGDARCPQIVTMRAYEVYCHVYAPQEAMVTGTCRGGFSTGELIAFLYARSFPKEEWRTRVDEAFRGMENL